MSDGQNSMMQWLRQSFAGGRELSRFSAAFLLGIIAVAALFSVSLTVSERQINSIRAENSDNVSAEALELAIAAMRLNAVGGDVESAHLDALAALDSVEVWVRSLGSPEALAEMTALRASLESEAPPISDAMAIAVADIARTAYAHKLSSNEAMSSEMGVLNERIIITAILFALFGALMITTAMRRNHHLSTQKMSLEASEAKLREISNFRSQFLANMSHDFRTPLNAIRGFSEFVMLQRETLSSDKIQEYLGHVSKSAQDLIVLTDNVLDLSKMDAGRFRIRMDETPVTPMVEEAAMKFGSVAEDRGLTLSTSIEDEMIARCDSSGIRRCISNLLSNAVKFSESGSDITLRAYRRNSGVFVIEVRDQGCGIAEKELQSIWMVYARSSETRNAEREGAGLGLAITKALMDAHGGFVEVQSWKGVGTSVRLCFPERLLVQTQSSADELAAAS